MSSFYNLDKNYNSYDQNNYKEAYQKLPEFSKREEMDSVVEVLTIDSADRDTSFYPNPNSYVVDLLSLAGRTFKNVKQIRLLTGTFPDQNNVLREPYLILSVGEFGDNMNGTNTNIKSGTCIIQPDRAITSGYFWNMKTDLCKCLVHTFEQPIELRRMTIRILDKSGALFSFGSDSSPPLKSLQHMLSFEIVMEAKKATFGAQTTRSTR